MPSLDLLAGQEVAQTPAALSDPRLSHSSSRSVRQGMVARYAAQLGNQSTRRMVQAKRAEEEGTRGNSGEPVGTQEIDSAVGQAERRAAEQEAADPIVTTTMNFGPHVQQPHWGSVNRVERANPFASRAYRPQPGVAAPGSTANVQAQDAEAGGVKFTVTAFAAAAAGGLTVTEAAGGPTLDSQQYTASGTVQAAGPKSSVGKWDIGFLQTVRQSSRNFYYNSKARTKSSDLCSPLPVRDGDTLIQPWYGLETVTPFAAAASDTQSATMKDTPGTNNSWDDPVSGEADTLDHTDGEDVFRSWLAVKNRTDHHKKYLRFADWQVDYSTAVDTTQAVGSRVTQAKTAGAKVTGTGNGMGGIQPQLFDPVANDAAKVVNTKW